MGTPVGSLDDLFSGFDEEGTEAAGTTGQRGGSTVIDQV